MEVVVRLFKEVEHLPGHVFAKLSIEMHDDSTLMASAERAQGLLRVANMNAETYILIERFDIEAARVKAKPIGVKNPLSQKSLLIE